MTKKKEGEPKCRRAAHKFGSTSDPRYVKCFFCDLVKIKFSDGSTKWVRAEMVKVTGSID